MAELEPTDEALVELVNVIGDYCDELHISQVNQLARAILPILTAREASARTEGRREGIEEAAKVISDRVDWAMGQFHDATQWRTEDAPDGDGSLHDWVFRALAEKQP